MENRFIKVLHVETLEASNKIRGNCERFKKILRKASKSCQATYIYFNFNLETRPILGPDLAPGRPLIIPP